MINTCLGMSTPMQSEFLLIRQVEEKLYGLRCTKRGHAFSIQLELDQQAQVYSSGKRRVRVAVTHMGHYSVDYYENDQFHPTGECQAKVFWYGEADKVADQIVEFFHEAHRAGLGV